MKFRIFCFIAIAMAFIPTTGFVCATRVEKMEADIAALQLQFTEIQKRVNNDQTQLTEMILRADQKLEELGSTQDQTHDRVAQQNIQLALELEKERAELANMRGRLDIQQKTIDELQNSLQTVMGSVASTTGGNAVILPSDQEALYTFINEKRAANDIPALKTAIDEFIKRYPTDQRIDPLFVEYIVLIYNENAFNDVITHSSRYLKLFPNSSSRLDVAYIMGDAAAKVGQCDLAQKSFAMLESISYRDAAARHKEVKANCKTK